MHKSLPTLPEGASAAERYFSERYPGYRLKDYRTDPLTSPKRDHAKFRLEQNLWSIGSMRNDRTTGLRHRHRVRSVPGGQTRLCSRVPKPLEGERDRTQGCGVSPGRSASAPSARRRN